MGTMRSYLRTVVAAIVIGSGLFGQGMQGGTRPAHAAFPRRDRIFAGLQGGGIYTSGNGGDSWQRADRGLPDAMDITSLAVAPGGRTIFAGTAGAGVYASTDDGRSWQDASGGDPVLAGSQIRSVLVSPTDGQLVYAATSDGYVGRSSDGGRHWQVTGLSTGGLTAMAIGRGHPSTLLVGTASDGLRVSNDGGVSWHSPIQNLPGFAIAHAFAASPAAPAVIYAGTDDGIYQTLDDGATWLRESRGIPIGATIEAVAADPLHGVRLVAGDSTGNIYRSLDGGTSWARASIPILSRIIALLYDPARPGTIFAGTSGSTLSRSTDRGAAWSDLASPFSPGRPVLCLAISLREASPADPVDPPIGSLQGVHYFAQTGHTVRGSFYAFYHGYGGLKVFGLPLSEAFSDHGQVVQYFERARLVLTTAGVRESPLGSLLSAGRAFPPADPLPLGHGYIYFGETGYWIAGPFLDFWEHHHGQLLFGDPISQPLTEQNGDGTGRTYQVQYFQNARLEYHPELAGTDNEVQLGLIGRQYLRKFGLL